MPFYIALNSDFGFNSNTFIRRIETLMHNKISQLARDRSMDKRKTSPSFHPSPISSFHIVFVQIVLLNMSDCSKEDCKIVNCFMLCLYRQNQILKISNCILSK